MGKISARLVLTAEEKKFCLGVAVGMSQAEAFRRAFEDVDDLDVDLADAQAVAKAASTLAKQVYIKQAIEEYTGDAGEMARQTFIDQIVTGTDKNASAVLGAARAIIEDESLQAAKSHYERFLYVASACGAVVRTKVGEEDVTVPLREIFPKFKEAQPPPEVLAKTAKSLAEWYDKLTAQKQELDERERQLTAAR